jgi:hypothetical protein
MKPIRKEHTMHPIRKELMTVEDLWTYLGLRHDDLWETKELHSPAFHIALSVIDTVRTMILNEEIK